MKKIMITGGTGYLGSQLIHALCAEYEICCIKLVQDSLFRLKDIVDRVEFIDVEDDCFEEKIKIFSPQIVIHTAAAYERTTTSFETLLDANLLFPLRVLQCVVGSSVEKWINTDTALPMDTNTYALTKRQFSQWGELYAKQGKIDFINIRLEHFYGKDAPKENFISWILERLRYTNAIDLTAGTQCRDFVNVEDVVRIYTKLVECDLSGYNEIPLGTGETPSVREIVTYLAELTGSSARLNFGAVPMRVNEPSSACNPQMLAELGLTPLTTWKDGLKQLV